MQQPQPENTLRIYVDGVEIDQLDPSPAFLQEEDWVPAFGAWAAKHHADKVIHAILDEDSDQGHMIEIWVGAMPPERPAILGGAVRRLRFPSTGRN